MLPIGILTIGALLLAMVLCVAYPLLSHLLTERGLGEPFAFFEGISVWPTVLVRAVCIFLCLWLICDALQKIKDNLASTSEQLKFKSVRLTVLSGGEFDRRRGSYLARLRGMMSLLWLQGRVDRHGDRRQIDPDGRPRVPILYWAVRYHCGGQKRIRLLRAALATAAMFVLWHMLLPVFGAPNIPARGDLAKTIYFYITLLDVFVTLFLIFLIADATIYARSFITRVVRIHSEWPNATVQHYSRVLNMPGRDLNDWLDMQFMAKRTRCIIDLIYYPFLVLALLIVSRSSIFDNYTIPFTLIISQAISIGVVIFAVVALRHRAERARETALEHLRAKLIAARGGEGDGKRASQLEMLLSRVENLREGAFAPLASQPIVKAVFLPLISYGGTLLLQLYALPGS
jgi:hypothetical protein